MHKLFAFLPVWWFLQIPTEQLTRGGNIFEYGIGVGMVLLIVGLWDKDRKSRINTQAEADKRYGVIVEQLKDIVQGNTQAMTTLADRLAGNITNCPLGNDPVLNAWLRAWMEHSIEERKKTKRTESSNSEF